MRNLFIAAAASAALASPAVAQMVPGDEPFTGLYVGGSFGGTLQPNDTRERVLFDTNLDGNFSDTVRTLAGADAFSTGFCPGFTAGATRAAGAGCRNEQDGIEYYARVGFDKQFGGIVAGIVGEFGRTEARDSVTAFSITPAGYAFTRTADYNAGLRARLGFTPGTTLFYATGGGAYARMDNEFFTTNAANSFTFDRKSNAWGWSAGGGVEQLLGNNFSVGLEYLYTSLKDDDQVVRVGPGTAPLASNPFLLVNQQGTDLRRENDRWNTHSMRVTAAFRF